MDDAMLVEVTPGERRVAPVNATCRDGCAEPPVGKIGLGDHHQPRRVSIESVDDAGPALGATG